MSVFDKVKQAVREAVVEDVPDAKPRNTPLPPMPMPVAVPIPGGMGVPVAVVAPDPGALASLEQRVREHASPVYLSFQKQFDLLASAVPDTNTRFKAALATSGATVEQLSMAIDQMIETAHQTAAAFSSKYDESVGAAQQDYSAKANNVHAEIQRREQGIAQMSTELASLRQQEAQYRNEADVELRRLGAVKAGFEAAHTSIVQRLNAEKLHVNAKG